MNVLGQDDDDFTYWMRLRVRYGDRVTAFAEQIEDQLKEFTKILTTEKHFNCASYHVFPFDSRSISVVMGDNPRSPGDNSKSLLSFSISLEDFDVDVVREALNNGVARVYRWRESRDDPHHRYDFKTYNSSRNDFLEFDPTSSEFGAYFDTIEIREGGLLSKLKGIYDEVIDEWLYRPRPPNP